MKPKILFVCPIPPPYGGLANNSQLLIGSSLRDRYDIEVFDTSRKLLRYRVHRRGFANLFHFLRSAITFAGWLSQSSHSLVYLMATSDVSFLRDAVLLLLAKVFGNRTVLHFHASQLRYFFSGKSRLCNLLLSLSLVSADTILFLSQNLMKSFSQTLMFKRSRLLVLNNVVVSNQFAGSDVPRHGSSLRVLFVGRLTREKGLWDILQLAPRILSEFPNLRFVFCGVGETEDDEAEIRRYCRVHGIEEKMEWKGQVQGQTKLDAFTSADVFVLPSYEEIFPIVLLEAMAAGLPVISTRIFCIPEIIIEEQNGFLIEPGDTDALEDRIRQLLSNEPLRRTMSANNTKRANAVYDVDVAARVLTSVFSDLGVPPDSSADY